MNIKSSTIYLLSGKARSGKDTSATLISEIYKNMYNQNTVDLKVVSPLILYCKNITGWDGHDDTKPRDLMNELVTKIRTEKDELFFIKRLIDDIEIYSNYFNIITVSDIRMPKEIEYLKKTNNKVISISISREIKQHDLDSKQKQHITETSLDNFKEYDYEIENNGNFEELKSKLKEIVQKEN